MNLDNLRKLIQQDRTEQAIKILLDELPEIDKDIFDSVTLLSAKFKDARRKSNMGLIDNKEANQEFAKINYALLSVFNELEEKYPHLKDKPIIKDPEKPNTVTVQPTINQTQTSNSAPKVFISYNHSNKDVANKLRDLLRAANIDVTIDSEKMLAGEDIKEFIEKCIRETNITLSLVSKRSLLSAWVAMESIGTYYHEKTDLKKKFIACYIDSDFFGRGYTDDALDVIDENIKEISDLITKRLEKGRNIRDLQNELTRYKELQHGIDEIVRRLRESLCIDVAGENLEKNFPKILESIK